MERNRMLKRSLLAAVVVSVIGISVAVVKTRGQESGSKSGDQWEYLVVAGPSTTNFTPTSSPRMRKEPNVPFGREAFVLEQHMDKLGANGWELVTVAGPPNDPAFYFKRRKGTQSD